jgi:cytochrome b6
VGRDGEQRAGRGFWAEARAWFEERAALGGLMDAVAAKSVPVHAGMIWYYFGGLTLFFFGIQVVTGILLLVYYRPTPSEAYESVQFIMTRVRFGWLIRSVHSWSANLMIFSAFVHMFSVAFLRSFRRPRELTWLSGAGLLGLALGFGFSGYLLPWNTVSYFATKVATDLAASLPVAGPAVGGLLVGGDTVGGAALSRFFALHVAVLPALALGLLGLHLALIQKHGISTPPWVEAKHRAAGTEIPQMPFFPHLLVREVIVWHVALAALGVLAVLIPWELGEKADPFASAPAGIRPEWYFLPLFSTLRLLPSRIGFVEGELVGLVGVHLLALGWALLPFWAMDRAGAERKHLVTGAGVLLVAYLITFTVLGYLQ